MRLLSLVVTATALLSSAPHARSLVGVWRLIEVNWLPMQETPPYGQLNRKEVYTVAGKVMVVRPDAPFSQAKEMGSYEITDGARVFLSKDGQRVTTPIQWLDDDHFFRIQPG